MIGFPHFIKKMLDYLFEFKISTRIDPKANPKNEILWNNIIKIGMTPALPR